VFSLKKTAKGVADAMYPPVCVHCHTRIPLQEVWLCGDCYEKLNYIPEQRCPKCGYPTEEAECSNCWENHYVFTQAQSVFLYEGSARSMVQELKYNGFTHIADWFANQMYKLIFEDKTMENIDFVTAVPLHRVRRRERGFNQSDLIALSLADKLNKPFTDKALIRKEYTVSQTILDGKSRRKNLRDAFKVGRTDLKDKSILLIDDVFTTGTTVNEAARTLKQAGVKDVYVITACHGL